MMRKKRRIMITIAAICALMIVGVLCIAFIKPTHKHSVGDKRVYHVFNDEIYYTRSCKGGHDIKYETSKSLLDVLYTMRSVDTVRLEEDLVLNNTIDMYAYIDNGISADPLQLNINIDLNGHVVQTQFAQVQAEQSMFKFNAPYGKLNFSIKNGKLCSSQASYIFSFVNNAKSGENIRVELNNVECVTEGEGSTPLFMHNTCYNVNLSAVNCKFIAQQPSGSASNLGVGAFINSYSKFNFDKCYFEGGDAIYVKRGTIVLNDCELVNSGLAKRTMISTDKFSAIGGCLTTECYKEKVGQQEKITEFDISIYNCVMTAGSGGVALVVGKTVSDDLMTAEFNTDCSIKIETATFNTNPQAELNDIIEFSKAPILIDGIWCVK